MIATPFNQVRGLLSNFRFTEAKPAPPQPGQIAL
jgi:hypothetical protein